jgi:hypothetical protein
MNKAVAPFNPEEAPELSVLLLLFDPESEDLQNGNLLAMCNFGLSPLL